MTEACSDASDAENRDPSDLPHVIITFGSESDEEHRDGHQAVSTNSKQLK